MSIYNRVIRSLVFKLDPETAHDLGIWAIRSGLAAKFSGIDVDEASIGLGTELFGLNFKNPLGLAAGFDKNAVAVDQLAALGFGFIETGTVTLRPQPGNDKPRLFRLPKDRALINRLGFNNDGAKAAEDRLSKIERSCVVGVNIGRNKDVPNEEAVENYVGCFEIVHPVADYVAVNISSPNTPDLRELQKGESLDQLLSALQEKNQELGSKPLLVKIAPDLTEPEIEAAVDKCIAHNISAIIATNTTVSRDRLKTPNVDAIGAGGLSGYPLRKKSDEVISKIYQYSKGQLPIIGVGGVFNGNDLFRKIELGASLVQAYTGFIYGGPRFAVDTLTELKNRLDERGFGAVVDAVGTASDLRA